MSDADPGRGFLPHQPACRGLKKVAIARPRAGLFRDLTTEREGNRGGAPESSPCLCDQWREVFIRADQRDRGVLAGIGKVVAIDLRQPRQRLGRNLRPAAGGLRADRLLDESRAGDRHRFLGEDLRDVRRTIGEEHAAVAKACDVFQQFRIRVRLRAHSDDRNGAALIRHFLQQLLVVAGFLRVRRIGEKNHVAGADIGLFQFIPSAFEPLVYIDATAFGNDLAGAGTELVLAVAHRCQRNDCMGSTVHGQHGHLIHWA